MLLFLSLNLYVILTNNFFWQIVAEIETHAPHLAAANVKESERRRGNVTETEIMTETVIEIGTETGNVTGIGNVIVIAIASGHLTKLLAVLSAEGDAPYLHHHRMRGAADVPMKGSYSCHLCVTSQ